MRWRGLLFAHWPVDADVLRPLVPAGLEIDTFEGRAYLGIVPFGMEDVAPRGLPALPGVSAFPEVNVRTYVRHGELGGIWFLSLDAASRLAVEGARAAFHLPYFHASMSMQRRGPDVIYHSERRDRRGPAAILDGWYRPNGPVVPGRAWITRGLADGPLPTVRRGWTRPPQPYGDPACDLAVADRRGGVRDGDACGRTRDQAARRAAAPALRRAARCPRLVAASGRLGATQVRLHRPHDEPDLQARDHDQRDADDHLHWAVPSDLTRR